MPKICYVEKNFAASSLEIIETTNEIIDEYLVQGYSLTLRQLYYQFVARNLIPNTQRDYKRLGSIVNDGRLAGLIDWNALEDRTRNLQANPHWNSPEEIVGTCARQFAVDKWDSQEFRPEVWVEKEALAGVVGQAASALDVPYFCCRGYTSQSEMWVAAMRLRRYAEAGQRPFVIHLGDHDPSGIDMTRDIDDRLALFMGGLKLERIALNMDQVEEFGPPPNPAKVTDSRAAGYIARFGAKSWELDALEPKILDELIRKTILSVRDEGAWDEKEAEEKVGRDALSKISDNWDDMQELISDAGF